MPRGRTASTLSLSLRRERAYELMVRGFNNTDIAKDLQVTPDTVGRYRADYESDLAEQSARNPRLLTNVLENTNRTLVELDEVRKSAWKLYETTDRESTKLQALRTLTSANQQRAALFGLIGMKQEYLIHVQNIQNMQNALLEWMRSNLCQEDRDALERFISAELQQYMGSVEQPTVVEATALPAIANQV